MSSVSTEHLQLTLNGSGAGSGTYNVFGAVAAVRVVRSAGSPVVTIADALDTVLNGVTVASNTTYHPQVATTTNDGTTATALYADYVLSGIVTVTVASGTAASVVDVYIKVYY
jgi:hypothetical protein